MCLILNTMLKYFKSSITTNHIYFNTMKLHKRNSNNISYLEISFYSIKSYYTYLMSILYNETICTKSKYYVTCFITIK